MARAEEDWEVKNHSFVWGSCPSSASLACQGSLLASCSGIALDSTQAFVAIEDSFKQTILGYLLAFLGKVIGHEATFQD
jgi:hypothetical protein